MKNFKKVDFKYLSQDLDNNVLDLLKKKVLYLFDYMTDFERFKEK